MAKINNRGIYRNIDNPSLSDFLLGTKEEDGKTKSFPLQYIIQLINGVNGKNNIQYQFSDGSDPEDIDYTTSGTFFTNNNSTSLPNFTELIFNKESLQPFDLSLLFNKIGVSEDIILKLEHPENPNIFFNLKVISFVDNTEYFVFGVQPFKDFYLGSLENEKIYSLYFDLQVISEEEKADKIIKSGNINISGLTISILENDFQWRINQQDFLNTPELINFPIPPAADGFYRSDILVGTSNNDYQLIQGTPDSSASVEPQAPINTIRIAGISLFGAIVGQPTPTPTTNFIEKSERANIYLTGSGVINQLNLVDEKATIVFKGSITRLNTISYASVPYNGKRITLFNAQATPVTIGHSVSGYGVDFVFTDGQDYILLPNQTIEFSFDITYAPYAHHMLIGSKTDISGKKNKTLAITTEPAITRTLTATDECIVFTNANPVAFTIPTNASVPIPIGTEVQYTQQGNGSVTVGGTGITFVTNISLDSVKGETRILVKIDTDTWKLQGTEVSLTKAQTFSQGLKTFLNGMLGLRNVANTFTSFFTNSNTASRTYTLPDKNGTVAMTSDIVAQLSGTANRLVKFGTTTTGVNSRIEDTGTYIGIDTVNTPTKDITLGNQNNKEFGIEDSDNISKGRDIVFSAGRTINYSTSAAFIESNIWSGVAYSMCASPSGNTYVTDLSKIYKQTGSVGAFVIIDNVGFYGIACDYQNNLYGTSGLGIYKKTNESGSWSLYYSSSMQWRGICCVGNDIYATVNGGDIYKQTGGVGVFAPLNQTSRSWYRILAGANDIFAEAGNVLYRQLNKVGDFLPHTSCDSAGFFIDSSNNLYKMSGVDIVRQINVSGSFSSTGTTIKEGIGSVWGMAESFVDKKIYAGTWGGRMYVKQPEGTGSSNLDGGTYKAKAGTGKGTGKSRVEFYTGQKTVSGTDMQIETLREYIDENGYHVYTSMPVFADNTAAKAGGLPIGCEYRTATGVKMIVY